MSTRIPHSILFSGTLLGSIVLAPLACASPTFHAIDLVQQTALGQTAEGKCGEGRCAANRLDTNGDGKVSYEEAMAAGFTEQQCRTWDRNHDQSLAANELAAMHAILDAPSQAPRKKRAK